MLTESLLDIFNLGSFTGMLDYLPGYMLVKDIKSKFLYGNKK